MKKTIYLLATYYKVPRNPNLTAAKGYMSNPDNYTYNEQVSIATKIKNRDLTDCQVILDMEAQKVVKCSMNPGQTFEELYVYFARHYPKYMDIINQHLNPDTAKTEEPAAAEQVV